MSTEQKSQPRAGLAVMRAEFPPNQISKLPKGTKAQNECQPGEKINCKVCGGWHHPKIAHLDYVGHAALTDRLLDADPAWDWAPLALTPEGLPLFDKSGGLWIRLTVCGVSRIGYGHAAAKSHMDPGAREKEVIGDALRNAAMRFGAALELWHKGGDLHGHLPDDGVPSPAAPTPPPKTGGMPESQVLDWIASVESMTTRAELEETRDKAKAACVAVGDTAAYDRILAAAKKRGPQLPSPKTETKGRKQAHSEPPEHVNSNDFDDYQDA